MYHLNYFWVYNTVVSSLFTLFCYQSTPSTSRTLCLAKLKLYLSSYPFAPPTILLSAPFFLFSFNRKCKFYFSFTRVTPFPKNTIQLCTLFHTQRNYICLPVLWVHPVIRQLASRPLHWVNSSGGASWWRTWFARACFKRPESAACAVAGGWGDIRPRLCVAFHPLGPQPKVARNRSVVRVWGFLVQQLWFRGGFVVRKHHFP